MSELIPLRLGNGELNQRVHNLDCRQGLVALGRESVPLIFADPPFNIDFKYDVYEDRQAFDDYLAFCEDWLKLIWESLTPDGTFWLAIGDAFCSELDVLAKSLGFHKRSQVVWYFTFGQNCTKKLTPSHTYLFHYVKHRTKFTFNDKAIRVPSARAMIYKDERAQLGGRLPDDTWILRPQWFPGGFKRSEDTWYIPRVCGTYNEKMGTPNQMPERVLGRIIELCSRPGDLVLDPFSGSGTTLAVAKKLGRQYIGFELSPEYSRIANERLDGVKVGDELLGPVPQGEDEQEVA